MSKDVIDSVDYLFFLEKIEDFILEVDSSLLVELRLI